MKNTKMVDLILKGVLESYNTKNESVGDWKFTEEEKTVLRSLPKEYQWIARDEIHHGLSVYTSKPTKTERNWERNKGAITYFDMFKHVFDSIKWTDDEPCEFRKYLK